MLVCIVLHNVARFSLIVPSECRHNLGRDACMHFGVCVCMCGSAWRQIYSGASVLCDDVQAGHESAQPVMDSDGPQERKRMKKRKEVGEEERWRSRKDGMKHRAR